MEDEHLVNATNWLVLDLRIGDGPWWSDGGMAAASERRDLDLRRGILTVGCCSPTPRDGACA